MVVVGDIITKKLLTISSDGSIEEAAKKMCENHISSLIVEKGGGSIGMVTETDIVKKVVAERKDLVKTQVNMVMTSPIITMESSKGLKEAYTFMAAKEIRHLPVTKDGNIIGIVSAKDLLAYINVATT